MSPPASSPSRCSRGRWVICPYSWRSMSATTLRTLTPSCTRMSLKRWVPPVLIYYPLEKCFIVVIIIIIMNPFHPPLRMLRSIVADYKLTSANNTTTNYFKFWPLRVTRMSLKRWVPPVLIYYPLEKCLIVVIIVMEWSGRRTGHRQRSQ